MYAIHRILIAVKDPRARSHAALDKAAQLARGLGAEVQLFHGIADPIYIDAAGVMAEAYPNLLADRREWYRQRLERLAQRLTRHGIRTSTAAAWDFPASESIVRQAARFEADLVIAECHPTAHHAPWLLRFTDWELLRLSPVPVLLVKSRRAYRRPKVLAAIDPTHAYAKPADLDEEILRYAATVADALRGALHAVHAYVPAADGEVAPGESRETGRGLARVPRRSKAESERALRAANVAWSAQSALREAVRVSGIPENRQHLIALRPARAIEEVARGIRSGLVVMGAVSRSGFKRLFIGNTAERVLDRLSCDVLVVKPRHFRSGVPRRPRGLQMIALPE